MKARVHITLKNGVLDPQGKAIQHALDGLGFDGVDEATRSTPPLTTIHQSSEAKGIKAAELFINRGTDSVIIPYYIEHGKSC